ncbi:MAG: hypothetical protein IJ681_10765, partial [Bacteroidales bacterium]|nr:hypothetical protein [Bacteroidales bacterium]
HLALCNPLDTSGAIGVLKIDVRNEEMSFLELFNKIKSEQDTVSVIKIGEQGCILSFNTYLIEEDVISYTVQFRFVKNARRYVLIFFGNDRIFERKNLSLIGSIANTFVIK